MILTEKDIVRMIKDAQLLVEEAYRTKLDDEYFKRGFLLATQEISKLIIESLKKYNITTRELNND